ncbi:hypothetical protein SDRG_12830 [Saprolegnia diclina VS20]|uniref:Uncharacterized protein n=1 Tax=Saprolegnia diclina (strain VS20) TaxID=1156394 RepID=T0Q447_SAPDV|nr:hypothetical protein SDRG_12830 [Saprolegnia diclina VS20]EQC29366.1 hypothetical protein SDRG_12830 [Saprolegnia diclina VS20]|eukprot:XP_008617133.1 hypothetical protein SDRG_12830 [Saprolegnia diclina VS20]
MRLGLLVPLAHAAFAQTITFPNTTVVATTVPAPSPPPAAPTSTPGTTPPVMTALLRTVTPTPWSAAPTTDAAIVAVEATPSIAPLSVTEAPPKMAPIGTRPIVALPSNPTTAPIFKPQESVATPVPSPASPSMEPKGVGGGVLGVVGGVIAAVGLLGACIMLGMHAKHRLATMSNEKSPSGSPPIWTPFDDAIEASITRLESTLLGSQRLSQLVDANPSAIVEASPVQRSSLVFESSRGSISVDTTHRGSYGGVALRVPSLLDHPPETYEMRLSIMAARASEPALDATGKPLPREMTF